ncbi:hypothetical protein EVAR_6383_1 [Eumeta japonica]|uniref:Uncharacterized protein n=1 Tax=Eumeta variegata TaxID=151549 RepID=A0A4C1TDJ1_EUMVA|nr:hypothetical protein EVAR_6383_1 [Eumeta japonica]
MWGKCGYGYPWAAVIIYSRGIYVCPFKVLLKISIVYREKSRVYQPTVCGYQIAEGEGDIISDGDALLFSVAGYFFSTSAWKDLDFRKNTATFTLSSQRNEKFTIRL